jgi:hypothetical protein
MATLLPDHGSRSVAGTGLSFRHASDGSDLSTKLGRVHNWARLRESGLQQSGQINSNGSTSGSSAAHPSLPGRSALGLHHRAPRDDGVTAGDDRLFVNAALHRYRAASHGAMAVERLGVWKCCFSIAPPARTTKSP